MLRVIPVTFCRRFLRRYCPDQQQCRIWSAKCRSVLYDWLTRFGKACVVLWGLGIAVFLSFSRRIRRTELMTTAIGRARELPHDVACCWRQLDRKWQIWSVCTLLAVIFLPLLFAFGGRGTGPSSESSNVRGDEAVKNGNMPVRHTGTAIRYSVTDLGTLGGETSKAYGINNSGQVVGMAATKRGEEHAFVWQASSGMFDILGQEGSIAFGINNSGQVVGMASGSSSEREVAPSYGRPVVGCSTSARLEEKKPLPSASTTAAMSWGRP